MDRLGPRPAREYERSVGCLRANGPRKQLLRALASDSIRGALQRHFGVVLAFQNCHRVAAFRPDRLGSDYAAFVSPREQLLNQSPELRDC